jgi:autotransporter-associated beta strand protein
MSLPKLHLNKKNSRNVRGFLVATSAALFFWFVGDVEASVRTWTGLGGNGFWSTVANWDTGAPGNNDSVVFTNGTANFRTTNDFVGLTLSAITFSGSGGSMSVRGNAVTLTSGINASYTGGADSCDLDIILITNIVIEADSALGIDGTVSGQGGFMLTGGSTLTLRGTNDNTYSGPTVIQTGTLQLDKSTGHALLNSSSLNIGDGVGGADADAVRYINANGNQINISVPIIINRSGLLDLNGHNSVVGAITLVGGDISTGTGQIQVNGDIAVQSTNQSANISGNLQLASGLRTIMVDNGPIFYDLIISAVVSDTGSGFKIVKGSGGAGFVRLVSSNAFTGPLTIDGLTVDIENPWSLGGTNGATSVTNSGGMLFLFSIGITNESVTLGAGTTLAGQFDCTWNGPVILTGNAIISGFTTPGLFDIQGGITGTGNLTSTAVATNRFSGSQTNNYTGTTTANGLLELNKSGFDNAIPNNLVINGTVRLKAVDQIANLSDVTVNSNGLLDIAAAFERIDALAGSGRVSLSGGYLDLGLGDGSSTFDGVISGPNDLQKHGAGTITLTASNTYSGVTIINAGTLLVDGHQPQSPVSVNGSGTLGGSGTVGTITSSGNVAPGASPGILTTSNLAFSASGAYLVDLTGPNAGTDYDQLNVRGTNSLASATLHVTAAFTSPVTAGQQFTLLNNDGVDAIAGTFIGYPEGAALLANGYKFAISYVGGTGNDVVLTLTDVPGDVPGGVVGSAVSSGNGNHSIDPNECNDLNLVTTNKTGTPMNAISATLSTTNVGVIVSQPYSAFPNLPGNGTGTNITPFQISTLPTFVCGTDIHFQLSMASSLGSFTTTFVQHTGEPAGAPVRYDVGGNVAIPDVGTAESANTVSGFTGPLQKVLVSLHLTHSFDADLTNISLIAPDGTTVLLSSANGGGGQNYGTACSPDASRTTFDDASGTPIIAGATPFVGTYRPQGSLAGFIGNATPNGNWRLHIADGFSGSTGILNCWSLFLYGTACNSGGGFCDLCLPAISGAITASDPVQTNRWNCDSIVGSCGLPKAWTGTGGNLATNYHYDAYVFTNTSGADACVTVELQSASDVMAAAYLTNFDATTISNNFMGDSGFSTAQAGGTTAFSCNIPAGTKFVVAVNEVVTNSGTQPYALYLSGLPCPQPTLAIDPLMSSPSVRVHWPTWAGGYKLVATPSLAPANWFFVTDEPIVTGTQFNVTNTAPPTDKFYRLLKP